MFISRRVFWICMGIMAALVAFRLADRLSRRTSPFPPNPTPNGYDALLSASKAVRRPTADLSELSRQAAREALEQNRSALEAAQHALELKSRVTVEIRKGWAQEHATNLTNLKRLVVPFALEARVHLAGQRTNAAARSQLNLVKLAHAIGRGGLKIDAITGLAVETAGVASLQALLPGLDAASCADLARELEVLEWRRDSAAAVLEQERRWAAKSFGLVSRIGDIIMSASLKRTDGEFTRRYHEAVRRSRKAIIRFAARACELQTGRPPESTGALVPRFLSSLPIDPENGSAITQIPPALFGLSGSDGQTPDQQRLQ
jgi:hypothetical protein